MKLSVIVPATDNPKNLPSCLASIDNATGCLEDLLVITEPPFSGPAKARNLGASRATGEILVFIDSDVSIHPDALARISKAFENDPNLTALFGSYDDLPTAPGLVSKFRNLLHHHLHQGSPGPASTFWAGLGAVKRTDFAAAGGFDEHRFQYPSIEDIDLGMRLISQGRLVNLDPQLLGTHHKSWTIGEMIRTDFIYRGSPWIALLLRHRTKHQVWPTATLNLAWRHRMSALVSVNFLGAVVGRKPLVSAGSLLALIAMNRSFYALLLRRLGIVRTIPCIGLHMIHYLTCAAAIPAGILTHLIDRREENETTPAE